MFLLSFIGKIDWLLPVAQLQCIEWIDVCNINGNGNTTNGGTIVCNTVPLYHPVGLGVRKIIETQSAITADLAPVYIGQTIIEVVLYRDPRWIHSLFVLILFINCHESHPKSELSWCVFT